MLKIADDFELPLDAVTETFALLAMRGSGKSYTAMVMAEEMIRAGIPLCVLDPIGVFWGLRSNAAGDGPGLPVVVFGGDHADIELDHNAGSLLADLVISARERVILDLSHFSKTQQRHFVTDFAVKLYRANREPLHVFLDEADEFIPQRVTAGTAPMVGAFEDLVRRGRARGIGLTMITQRPAVLNKDVLSQVGTLFALRLSLTNDRKAIFDWIGGHELNEGLIDIKATIASLPIGDAWIWSPGWLKEFRRIHIRVRETFDSSATPKLGHHEWNYARQYAGIRLSEIVLDDESKTLTDCLNQLRTETTLEIEYRDNDDRDFNNSFEWTVQLSTAQLNAVRDWLDGVRAEKQADASIKSMIDDKSAQQNSEALARLALDMRIKKLADGHASQVSGEMPTKADFYEIALIEIQTELHHRRRHVPSPPNTWTSTLSRGQVGYLETFITRERDQARLDEFKGQGPLENAYDIVQARLKELQNAGIEGANELPYDWDQRCGAELLEELDEEIAHRSDWGGGPKYFWTRDVATIELAAVRDQLVSDRPSLLLEKEEVTTTDSMSEGFAHAIDLAFDRYYQMTPNRRRDRLRGEIDTAIVNRKANDHSVSFGWTNGISIANLKKVAELFFKLESYNRDVQVGKERFDEIQEHAPQFITTKSTKATETPELSTEK